MRRRAVCLLAMVLLLVTCAKSESRVFTPDTTEPFDEDAVLLTVYVAPLIGGDSMLLTLGDHSMFVDLGTEPQIGQINEVIQAAGIDRAEYFFNTHPHADHIGGFVPLIEEGFPVGTMFTFFPHDYTGRAIGQIKALRAAEAAGVQVVDLKTEDTVPFGNAELTAYRIPDDMTGRASGPNDLSAMLIVRYGDCSILLAADVEFYAQKVLAGLYDLKADILKYPHHGLAGLDQAFMDNVDPEYVVISHGSTDTVLAQDFLRKTGYHRVAFASWGIIVMQTDGQKWIVRQEIVPRLQDYSVWFHQRNDWIEP